MNFKKFISGISALTIAAGAFAAMAVTASAETTYDTLGSWAYANGGGRVTGSATAVEATETEEAYTTITINGHASYNGVYNGNVHKGSGSGAGSAVKRTSGTRVATQDIRFHTDSGNNIAEYLGATSKSGGGNYRGMNAVASFKYDGSTLTLSAGSASDTYAITADAWYTLTVTAEYSDSATDVTVELADATGTTVKTVKGSATNYDINTFAASTRQNGAGANYFDSKNESIGTVAPSAGTVTVSLKDGNGASLADDIVYDVSDKLLGDSFTYYYPAYIDKNGTLYKADANAYGVSVSLLTTDDKYEVKYVPTDYSVYKFKDFDDKSVDGVYAVTATAFSNGALTGGDSGQQLETFTIDEDGVYTAIVNAGCVASDSVKTGNLYVNGVSVGSVSYTNYSGTLNTFNLSLKKDDVITVSIGRGASSGLDYVLFYKTAKAQIDATNEGAFTSDEDETETATAFLADTNNVSGNVDITITPSSAEIGEAKTFSSATTLTDATATFGIIVNGLYDAAATAVVTIK